MKWLVLIVFAAPAAWVLLAVAFEAHRIGRVEQLEKEVLRRRLSGG